MTAELFQEITTHGAAVNLSSRCKFRLTGADRIRYLNGQVTNDVRRANAAQAMQACVTDVKGRIAADVFLHATAEALLLDAEPGLREALGARLERYIVSDDVELTDVTDDWQLWHVFGAAKAGGISANRFDSDGADLWLPAGEAFVPSCLVLSDADAETWRILQHVPRWPHELGGDTFPPEAGLEARAMDFFKGCYIGQEVLSRIKTTGKMPREMISFESKAVVQAGDELWLEKTVGRITSVTRHPITGHTVGLAMVRQGTPKNHLRVGSSDGPLLIGE